ncbi:MAG: hypothetical protein Q7U51_07945 [Methanoregula sp.]|nr:hypothetical protein [Methanoregula sp.]
MAVQPWAGDRKPFGNCWYTMCRKCRRVKVNTWQQSDGTPTRKRPDRVWLVPAFWGSGKFAEWGLLGERAVPEKAQLLRNRKARAPPVPSETRGLAGLRVPAQP